MKRTDVIIDYHGRQYICELKIWQGEEYNRRGEQQLIDYLRDYNPSITPESVYLLHPGKTEK